MKIATITCLTLVLAWVVLFLLQLWGPVLAPALFIKLTITAAVLVGVILIAALAIREYVNEKKLKDDGYIDS